MSVRGADGGVRRIGRRDGISGTDTYQSYTLDTAGDWSTFDDNGTSQTRSHNDVNEIDTDNTHGDAEIRKC